MSEKRGPKTFTAKGQLSVYARFALWKATAEKGDQVEVAKIWLKWFTAGTWSKMDYRAFLVISLLLRSIFGFRTLVDGVAGVTLGRAWLRSFPYYSCFRELSSEVQVKYVSFLSLHVAWLIFSLLSYQIVYIKSEAIYLESSTYMAHNLVLNWDQHMRTGNMVRHASTGVARSQTEFSLETGGKGGHGFRALYAIYILLLGFPFLVQNKGNF